MLYFHCFFSYFFFFRVFILLFSSFALWRVFVYILSAPCISFPRSLRFIRSLCVHSCIGLTVFFCFIFGKQRNRDAAAYCAHTHMCIDLHKCCIHCCTNTFIYYIYTLLSVAPALSHSLSLSLRNVYACVCVCILCVNCLTCCICCQLKRKFTGPMCNCVGRLCSLYCVMIVYVYTDTRQANTHTSI